MDPENPFPGNLARGALPDLVAEQITTAIANGTLSPGDRLPSEPQLAKQLGVGRTSLREALRHLNTLGVLTVVRGRGTFVNSLAPDSPPRRLVQWSVDEGQDAEETLEVRAGLEAAAAALACRRASDADLELLTRTCSSFAASSPEDDPDAMATRDREFHDALVAAAHNTTLQGMHESLMPSLREFRLNTLAMPGAVERSALEHRAIAEAIQARDAEKAVRAVVQHLAELQERVRVARHPTAG